MPVVALDLLREPAARHRGAGRARGHAPSKREQRHHRIDYAGTVLLAAGLSAIVLLTTLGGNTYDWGSPQVVLLGVIGVACLVAFAFVERRAAEPILPLELFRNRMFVVTGAVAMVVGFALFGALTYLPLFQQVVRGLSPTASGLQLLPVMAGLLVSSIVAGQIITRTGRYKAWPIAGTAVAALGMWMLSSLDESTGSGVAALHMLVLGLGLGMVMRSRRRPSRPAGRARRTSGTAVAPARGSRGSASADSTSR